MRCIHHWVIDPPDGPVSNGKCIKCGAEGLFPNEVMLKAEWKDLDEMGTKRRKENRERKLRADFAMVGAMYGKVNR